MTDLVDVPGITFRDRSQNSRPIGRVCYMQRRRKLPLGLRLLGEKAEVTGGICPEFSEDLERAFGGA
jgi:hypothetical protein